MRRKDREVSDPAEIKSIIDKCKVCHLAMAERGRPYVVPLNFGYILEAGRLELFFHSAREGRKIDILRVDNQVCFEMAVEGSLEQVIDPCNSGYFFESVIGFGKVEFIEDPVEKSRALALLMKHQTGLDFSFTAQQAGGVCVFKVVSRDFSGKRKLRPTGPGR